MSFSDLIPWKQKEKSLTRRGSMDPFTQLQQEMDRLFDEFRGFGMTKTGESGETGLAWLPAVNVTEDDLRAKYATWN